MEIEDTAQAPRRFERCVLHSVRLLALAQPPEIEAACPDCAAHRTLDLVRAALAGVDPHESCERIVAVLSVLSVHPE